MEFFTETYRERSVSTGAFECDSCGALVLDRARHDIFHRALRETHGFMLGLRRSEVWAKIRSERAE
jgi:hypothetical protein